ncbi:MAG TPA: SCO family protein [Solirubrobacteraceae bacterium]|nr:SCO family protein [Solirubrobacteraceae bacterium]
MRLRPRPARVALAAAAVLAALALAAVLASSGGNGSRERAGRGTVSAGRGSRFEGAPLPGGVSAPGFALRDQEGRRVWLGEFRGRVVVLTFLYSTCGAPCVLIAQQIRGALDELRGEHVRAPAVLIVSADPAADTRRRVARFLAEASLTGRARYLTGSRRSLRRIWRAYGVRPASDGRAAFAQYASVLLIDGSGAERVLYQSEQLTPEALSHDVATLERSG